MDRWQEHLPVASASLRSTFLMAARNGVQFSATERALFTTCEFWIAVRAGNLAPYVAPGPSDALRYVGILYAAIGADSVAAAVFDAAGEFERAVRPQERERCLAMLEERLLTTTDPVDQLIARLAVTLGFAPKSTTST